MIVLRRVAEAEYELEVNGEVIKTYKSATMRHPDDWIGDARDADATVSGPYDWEYVNARDE